MASKRAWQREKQRRRVLTRAYRASQSVAPPSSPFVPYDLSWALAPLSGRADSFSRVLPAVEAGMMACPYCGDRGHYPACEAERNHYREHTFRAFLRTKTPRRDLIPRTKGLGVALPFRPLTSPAPLV
jgi:hypothetical protein